jgi:hypothetical protein
MSFLGMKTAIGTLVGASLAGAAIWGAPAWAAPASPYDGNWSVLIVTDKGTCDRAYRYAVRIQNGTVHYDGEAGINLTGRVARNGAVNVSLSRGEQRANGSGRLAGAGGSGKWSGKSTSSECSGHWEAERRAAN